MNTLRSDRNKEQHWRKEVIGTGRVEVERFGDPSSSKKLILLHGGPGMDGSYFKGYVEELSAFGELVMYRQGQNKRFSMEELLQELSSVVSALNSEKIFLIAHSFGGALALEWLKNYTDVELHGLVLISQVTKPGWNAKAKKLRVYDKAESIVESAIKNKVGDERYKFETIAYAEFYFREDCAPEGREALETVQYNEKLRERIYEEYLITFNLEPSLRLHV